MRKVKLTDYVTSVVLDVKNGTIVDFCSIEEILKDNPEFINGGDYVAKAVGYVVYNSENTKAFLYMDAGEFEELKEDGNEQARIEAIKRLGV